MREMMRLERMSTAVVASPIESPLNADAVVPRVGHIPRRSTKVGFSSMTPFLNIFKYLFIVVSPFS